MYMYYQPSMRLINKILQIHSPCHNQRKNLRRIQFQLIDARHMWLAKRYIPELSDPTHVRGQTATNQSQGPWTDYISSSLLML